MFHPCWQCTAETAPLDWHNTLNALEWVPRDELFYCLRGSFTASMHTLFCNPFCHGHCCTHYPMTCLARVQCQLNAIFLCDEGICVALIVIHYGCTWASRFLLVVNVYPAIIKSTVQYPHIFQWCYMSYMQVHRLAINFHWCDTTHMKKSSHTVFFDIWPCLQ